MNRGELIRRRRCRLLQLAMLFGILLPIFSPSWITLGAAAAGEVVLAVTWWRECRGAEEAGRDAGSGSGLVSGD